MEFQDKLRLLRKEKGMSQEALAGKLNVSRQAVSKWEVGEAYPEMDKLIMISNLFDVSLDFLIKDKSDLVSECNEQKYYMCTEEIENYLIQKKSFARNLAFSISGIILNVNIIIILSELGLEIIGAFVFFMILALLTGMIIMVCINDSNNEILEKKRIYIDSKDLDILKSEYISFKSCFGIEIALGVGMIILSIALVILIEEFMHNEVLGVTQLLTVISISVYKFINLGIRDDMYKFLVLNDLYIKEQEREKNSLLSLTMSLAAFVYILLGFVFNYWHPGWIIFPVTAIVTNIVERLRSKK